VWETNRKLIGSESVLHALATRGDPATAAQSGLSQFLETRRKYLLYR
jgi:hypothetical protein